MPPDQKNPTKYNESPISVSEINQDSEGYCGVRASSNMGIGNSSPIDISYGAPHEGCGSLPSTP